MTSKHDRARRRPVGCEALKAARSRDPLTRQRAHGCCDAWCDCGDRVILVRLDSHNPRRLGGPKPDRELRPEGDRDLAEDVARLALADNAVDAVDRLHRLDSSLEEPEEGAVVTLACGVFALYKAEIRSGPSNLLAVERLQVREHADPPDIFPPYH